MKSAKHDNNWIGVMGVSVAYCYDKNNNLICTTLDAPNPVAYNVQKNSKIIKVIGLLGAYNMTEMLTRPIDKNSFSNFEKFTKQF